jgi:hypothetical protein
VLSALPEGGYASGPKRVLTGLPRPRFRGRILSMLLVRVTR